jgi:excisionase family DNA binding protein
MEDDMAQTENLTLRQVSTWLNVSDRAVLEMMGNGTLKGFKVGGQWRFHSEDVEAYLNSLAVPGTDADSRGAEEAKQEQEERQGGAIA